MGVPDLLTPYSDMAERELRSLFADRSQPLYQIMAYQLGWVREDGSPVELAPIPRVRASLCLVTCEALGGTPERALPAAAAVELTHHFLCIHDDIQDGTPQQGQRSSVWWVWGPAQAINAGDGMHAMAHLALFRLQERLPLEQALEALRVLGRAGLESCEGQFHDLNLQERVDVSVKDYLRMVELRTGALFGGAMELGALVAGAGVDARQAFAGAGRKLGMAYHLRQDVLDLWGPDVSEAPGGNVLNKSKSFPIAYAFEHGSLPAKRELGTLYFKRVLEAADVPRIVAILDGLGAREHAQETAEQLVREALAELERSGARPGGLQGLREVAEYLVRRDR
ncbi:MAG: polyprenyl synthetase family protein [Chloroflexi bacterium]|nr:polyprenyl synthetase family protein [Chloroflexota bacterium]